MLIGYARVSTYDQTLALQQDALTKAVCTKLFTDTASGAKAERKGLDAALAYVRSGDTLVVWRLDRLGRSLPHLITTMTSIEERGIGFKSLTENIDTTTSGGKAQQPLASGGRPGPPIPPILGGVEPNAGPPQ
jgi:DNA invertase Pin-like site-specific DNA recombinase